MLQDITCKAIPYWSEYYSKLDQLIQSSLLLFILSYHDQLQNKHLCAHIAYFLVSDFYYFQIQTWTV